MCSGESVAISDGRASNGEGSVTGTALLEMGRRAYEAVLVRAASFEGGDRERPYSALKWWGRRFKALVRDLLAASVLEDNALLLDGGDYAGLAPRASGKLVYDPFVGVGTIVVEAAKLGFRAVGVDIDPAAVAVTDEALCLVRGVCESKCSCLVEALRRTKESVGGLWRLGGGDIIHVFPS